MVASTFQSGQDIAPILLIMSGGIAVAYWKPLGALFALAAGLFLLNACHLLLPSPAPLSLVAASIHVGYELRTAANQIRRQTIPDLWQDSKISVAVTAIIAVIVVSLCGQLWTFRHSVQLRADFWHKPVLPFSDQHYFLTSGFVWLQGLFFFKRLVRHREPALRMLKYVLIAWYGTIVAAFFFQFLSDIPYPYQTYAYYFPSEDIHAFGTVVVTGMVFVLAVFTTPRFSGSRMFLALSFLMLVGMVIASWSRATWLAAVLFSYILTGVRLPMRWIISSSAALLFCILIVNYNAHNEQWTLHPYLSRLITLCRIENPIAKSSGRYDLARKAVAMIKERPFAGHGIGTFFLKSPQYARPDDPRGSLPEFAHNAVLQLAAELGLPVALLFLSFITATIWKGCLVWFKRNPSQLAPTNSALAFALSVSLSANLWTQLSANAINIYLSSQMFFWFLIAALLGAVSLVNKSYIPVLAET